MFPRIALVLVWLFGGEYLMRAFEHWVWPVLGFIFLPLTTLTFAFAMNSLSPIGDVGPFGWVLIVLAGMVDLGLLGHSSRRSVVYVRGRRRTA